jgi:PIN domain nuclease of toxin-antitoxin system
VVSATDALRYFREAGYEVLDIRPEHAPAIETLPSLHSDPFDRILTAQALTTPLRLLTRDAMVAAYSTSIITV